jgi:hypothetical protein
MTAPGHTCIDNLRKLDVPDGYIAVGYTISQLSVLDVQHLGVLYAAKSGP